MIVDLSCQATYWEPWFNPGMGDDIRAWWGKLSQSTRRRLAADPFGAVPGELLSEVTNAGRTPIATHWVGVQAGTDRFLLPPDVQQWIADEHQKGWRLVRGDTNQKYSIVNDTGEDARDVELSAVGPLMINSSSGWSSTRSIVPAGKVTVLDDPNLPIHGWANKDSGIKISWRVGDGRAEVTLLIKDIDYWKRGYEATEPWKRGFRLDSSPASGGVFGVVYMYARTGQDGDVSEKVVDSWRVTLTESGVVQVNGEGYGTLGQGDDGLWRMVDTVDQPLSIEGQAGSAEPITAALDFVQRALQESR